MFPILPIHAIIDELLELLKMHHSLILVAPPGAGKTTYVPLVLKDFFPHGKIIVVEPRRIAARAASLRMASLLNESLGETIGLKIRFESKSSAKTRIEVVTEGIFTRMFLDNPDLPEVACVIFDEFHERAMEADFGLALALDAQSGLREDLKIIVMSATLDGASVSKLMDDAPIIHSLGRSHPITTHYLGRIPKVTLEEQMAMAVEKAVREETGSILAFLPGQGEITRLSRKLHERQLGENIDIVELYGAKDANEQARAIAPALANRRKIVLATAIAETSITIEGVRVVIDSGFSRVPRYEPDIGVTRLETVRSSRATHTQRQGRAGRTQAGVCYRLWDEREEGAFAAFPTPEILSADLSPLVLSAAEWGVSDLSQLKFQDAPPVVAVKEAKRLLMSISAIDDTGQITKTGKALRALPLNPRLSKMVVAGEALGYGLMASQLALILSEKGVGGDDVSLLTRFENLRRDNAPRAKTVRSQALSMVKNRGDDESAMVGQLLLLAYPERLAKARGKLGEFTCANGRGCYLEAHHPLAREAYIVVAEMMGSAQNTRIVTAVAFSESDVVGLQTVNEANVFYHSESASMRSRSQVTYGALVLSEKTMPIEPSEENARMLGSQLLQRDLLPFTKAQKAKLNRLAQLRQVPLSEILAPIDEWLTPVLVGKSGLKEINADDMSQALDLLIDYNTNMQLEKAFPSHFVAPTGNSFLIDYEGEEPVVSLRVTELYGLSVHPTVASGTIKLTFELLSPAHRPVQTTRDLIGFWNGTYKDVRVEMKGRYPRHSWPENPMEAVATARAKPRGT